MRTTRSWAVVMTALVAGLLLPAAAGAQNAVDQARRHADEGQAALAAGDFQRALEAYRRAHDLFPNALLLVNVARAESGLGMHAAAIVTLRRVLADADVDAARKREVEAEVQRLRGLVVELTLRVTPAEAQVQVNGRAIEDPTEPIFLPPGTVTVTATLDGHADGSWTQDLVAGARATAPIELRPSGTASEPDGAGGSSDASDDGQGDDVAPPPRVSEPSPPRTLMWVTGIGAGALGIGALSIGGYMASVHADCHEVGGDCRSANSESLNALALVADIMGGVAIAGAVVFVILLTTSGDASEATATALAEPGVLRF